MLRIGIYGGSFDPIHFGHLNLAMELMETHDLSEVWFIPAQLNPHKLDSLPIPVHHRIAMIQLAIEEIPQFSMKDLESQRPSPSYTIETIKELYQGDEGVNRQFFLMLGEDAVPGFFLWKDPEEIVAHASLLIGSRSGWPTKALEGKDPIIKAAILAGLTKTRQMNISSSEIRQRLHQGKYCGHLVPSKVLDYIRSYGLYV